MKKLTKNIPTIVAALRTSTELEVSPEGQRVRRLKPFDLININFEEIRSKTVISWNLPDKPTIEYVMGLFSTVGEIEMARIRKTEHPEPLLTRGLKIEVGKNARECYALVEYKTREDAIKAVETLHDESNWRSGLRVKLLMPVPVPVEGKNNKNKITGNSKFSSSSNGGGGFGGNTESAAVGAGVGGGEVKSKNAEDERKKESQKVEEEEEIKKERPKPSWARGGAKHSHHRDLGALPPSLAAASGANDIVTANAADSVTNTSVQHSEQQQQPRMPDAGSRGFGVGRGAVPSTTGTLFTLLSLDGTILKSTTDSASVSLNGNIGRDSAAPGSLMGSGEGGGKEQQE
jgi:La-related protein 7